MLYYIANDCCLPFITPDLPRSQWHEAVRRRSSGEPFPTPAGVDRALGEVICRACAYRPEDRFESAQEMYHALQTVGTVRTVQKVSEPEEPDKRGGFDPLGYLWKQLGLSVTEAPEEEYMKRRLSPKP